MLFGKDTHNVTTIVMINVYKTSDNAQDISTYKVYKLTNINMKITMSIRITSKIGK